jgi:predicted TIM-barrel fold metal-dependent hydrolase
MLDDQPERQRELKARLFHLGNELAKKQGMTRRQFFRTPAGMAACFLSINETFGPIFQVNPAEAATPDLSTERSKALKDQFIMDADTYFLRDDTSINAFIGLRQAVANLSRNQSGPPVLKDIQFENYINEVFFESDTKMAILSSSSSDLPEDWFLTNEQMALVRQKVNTQAGSRRLLTQALFTPGEPGWLDHLDAALAVQPDAVKGYTIGDNIHKESSRYPWRMDDEKLTYKAYEKFLKAGVINVFIHKGLFPIFLDSAFARLRPFVDTSDVGRAAKDWPQLNFIICNAAYRHFPYSTNAAISEYQRTGRGNWTSEFMDIPNATGMNVHTPNEAIAEYQQTGRLSWTSDLADLPGTHGVNNVFADIGNVFGTTLLSEPRLAAAVMGILIKGLGSSKVLWGTSAVWTGSPQWQIEGLRRLEIPEDMQTKYGYTPLGQADGPVKSAIFGTNCARLFGLDPQAAWLELKQDRFTRQRGP